MRNILLAILLMTGTLQAQDAYHSDTWPGQTGKCRAGCDLSTLTLTGAQADKIKVGEDGWIVRRFRQEGNVVCIVRARVLDTPLAAQKELLALLKERSINKPWPSSTDFGDVAFLDGTQAARFTRANIVVRIDRVSDNFTIDLMKLATAVDTAIQKRPEALDAAFLPKPTITELMLEEFLIQKGSTALLTITASAPGDPELFYAFETKDGSTGAASVQKKKDRFELTAEKAGSLTLRCHVTTATGLRTSRELQIQIQP